MTEQTVIKKWSRKILLDTVNEEVLEGFEMTEEEANLLNEKYRRLGVTVRWVPTDPPTSCEEIG